MRLLLNFSVDHLWLLSPWSALTSNYRPQLNKKKTLELSTHKLTRPLMFPAQLRRLLFGRIGALNRTVFRVTMKGRELRKTFYSSGLKRNRITEQLEASWPFSVGKFSTPKRQNKDVFVSGLAIGAERCSVRWKIFVHLSGISFECNSWSPNNSRRDCGESRISLTV